MASLLNIMQLLIAMDLDMIALVKDSQANKTLIITRLVMEQQGNLLVHKEAPAQGGQVKVNTLETLFRGFRLK